MGRQALMKKQKLQREARKAGHKTREAQNKYVKNKVDKTGSTWVGRSGKIIQADEGRNKGRLFKEKVGQDIGKVRKRQAARRSTLSIKNKVGNWLRKKFTK